MTVRSPTPLRLSAHPVAPSTTLGYHAPLDGLRGLAILAIIAYHSDIGWTPGAFLSVSTFFTLSGFLITNLLLTEFDSSNGIRLGNFYSRRWKRLLPAGLLCLFGIVLLRFAGAFAEVRHLRSDLTAATLQVFNWTELSHGTSYADLFAASAPLQQRALSAGMFGSGFTLRLARAEARAVGGSLERQDDALRLVLPILTGHQAGHAAGQQDVAAG